LKYTFTTVTDGKDPAITPFLIASPSIQHSRRSYAMNIGFVSRRILSAAGSTVMVNGFAYQQCGSTWYQPQMSGSSTNYVVVNSPY
jgi:hypothetical protein